MGGMESSSTRGARGARDGFVSMGRGIANVVGALGRLSRAFAQAEMASIREARARRGAAGGATGGSTADRMAAATGGASGSMASGGFFTNFMGAVGNNPWMMGGPGAGKGIAAGGAYQLGSAAMGGMDARINAMYTRGINYDQLSMLYQQTKGITQNRFANAVLQPLGQYKLGIGGASTLLGLQASTGLSAQGNAAGVAGLRAATGFAYSTQDMSQMMATLASPAVNNRMSMTLGTGMYGPGGSQRNIMQVMQQIVRGAGLTNERVVQSGMQLGSVTRARLSAYGVPEDMQDMVLNYAKSNIQFKKKGGVGMYDPNDPASQKLMGIDKNFANKREETEAAQEARDMQFYKRQADNYATLENNTRRLTEAFGRLEDRLSGLVGARVSTRNHPGMQIGKGILGVAMMAGGAAMASTGAGAMPGMMLATMGAGMTASAFTGFSQTGDPVGKDYSVGYGGKKVTLGAVASAPSVAKLNPKFRERLLRMIQDNPSVGIGSGFRDPADQRTMFLGRYSKTSEKTDIFWEGSYWKKKEGVAPAAPPGFSMHEIGLAADLTGDLDWVQKNAAKYGLKTFGGVNGEPWHVQPAELPNSRPEYEKSGAKWGTSSGERPDPRAIIAGITDGGVIGDRFKMSQKSISDTIAATSDMNRAKLSQLGSLQGPGTIRTTSALSRGGKGKRGRLKPEEVAAYLYAAGFRGDDLAKALAISYRESIGFDTNAYNGNRKTGDASYGLFQINMIGKMGERRRKAWKLKSNDDLFDPIVNIRVANEMYRWNKGNNRDPFHDWGPYKGVDAIHGGAKTYYPKAQAVAKQITGDPAPVGRVQSSGGGGTFVEGTSVTVHAPITISGGGAVDAHAVAQEAAKVIERQVKIAMMRRT
jgi:hypothetical protein